MNSKKLFINVMKNLIMIMMSLIILVPLLLVIINSFKGQYESAEFSMALPKEFHFENYSIVIIQGKLVGSFFNSLLYAACPIIPLIIVSSMAAFIFSRNKTKLNSFLYLFIIMGQVIPVNYVTLTKVMQITNLNHSKLGLILLYISSNIAFTTFLYYGSMNSVPKDLDEAAIIDGCSPLRMFIRIILPLLKPLNVTVVILAFMNTWNDFINPIFFTNRATDWPVTLAVYNFFAKAIFPPHYELIAADIILTSIPVVIVYILGQKYIITGMTMGSVKG